MRVLIVDDEAAARRRLAALIEEVGGADVEIAGEAASGLEALDLVRERHPDVLLLDIAMPEVDGFDVARHLPDPRPLVIFQTAYHEFALQAFDHDALDYVVKPVTRERLVQALERARGRLAERRSPAVIDGGTLERLGAALGHHSARPARILVRHAAAHRLVPVRDIKRFLAADGLVYAETSAGRAATDYTLNELETRMRGTFLRVNRAELVSVAHIRGIASNGDGSATLTLTGDATVHVSRRRAAAVRAALRGPFIG